MARRRSIRQQLAVRRDQIELDAGIEDHQPVEKRFQRLAINLAPRIEQRFTGNNLLRQPDRKTLDHRITVLRAAIQLNHADRRRAKQQQRSEHQRQALAQA